MPGSVYTGCISTIGADSIQDHVLDGEGVSTAIVGEAGRRGDIPTAVCGYGGWVAVHIYQRLRSSAREHWIPHT